MSVAYSPLEERLMGLLEHLPNDALEANWSDSELTRQLTAKLGEGGRAQGYWVASPHWTKADNACWPHDLVWLDLAPGQLKGVKVALEVEWGLEHSLVLGEFQKLLAARAETRVMVAQQKTKAEAEALLAAMAAQVAGFGQTNPGDRYLLACSDFKSAAFTFQLLVCP